MKPVRSRYAPARNDVAEITAASVVKEVSAQVGKTCGLIEKTAGFLDEDSNVEIGIRLVITACT